MKADNDSISRVKVLGIGDFGCRTIDHLARERYRNIELIAVNTDVQSLLSSDAHKRIVIRNQLTHGQSTFGNPNLGRTIEEETENGLRESVKGADVVFLTAGLGGATATRALPFIARIAQEAGALTIGSVTLPFSFEGKTRTKLAENAVPELEKQIHTLILVPGDSLMQRLGNPLSLDGTFTLFADMLFKNIVAIYRLFNVPSLINLDLADIRTLLSGGPQAIMGFGQASSENQAEAAAKEAMENALGSINLSEAKSVLFSVTSSPNLSLFDVNRIASTIQSNCAPDVNLLFGAITRPTRENLEVTLLATGMKSDILPNKDTSYIGSSLTNNELISQKPVAATKLKVFLCHSSADKPVVRKLYQRLYSRRGIDPWLDEAKLLPGVRWDNEIAKAVKVSDVVIVCISNNSVNKEGYVQKEIKRALDIADEKPEDTIFIIPLKIEECDVPERLSQWQWVNYYEDGAFDRLMSSLQKRASSVGIEVE